MDSIDTLVAFFEKFPGIGPRQARRFVQYLLSQNNPWRAELAEHIRTLGSETSVCKRCFRWFVKNTGVTGLCSICANSSRDKSLLFVLEKDSDIEPVERSSFKGLYFVLGGVIPLAEEFPERFIRLKELLKRIEVENGSLKEIILGLSATAEGDHTRLLLQEKLLALSSPKGFKVSSLGRGLSTGSELEYADPDTITQALGNRR